MRFLTTAFLCFTASAFAQGGAAIITLVMPPPGGDGYSALQSGGAFPTGAASLYYNPALLSGLQAATGSQLHFSASQQDLLPDLDLNDLSQTFQAGALVLPDPAGRFDVGVGFFRNHINFGRSLVSSGDSDSGASVNAQETVYGLGASVRLASPIHLGGAIKFYDSQGGETAQGWAFDLGLAVLPTFRPVARASSLEISPSAGLALQNMGPDAWYVTPEESDPIPTSLRASAGLRARYADLLQASFGVESEKEVHRRADSDDPGTRTTGMMVQVAVFQIGQGRLYDRVGERDEEHHFSALEFNALQLYRIFGRIKAGDFSSPSETFDAGFPFAKISVLGIPYRANPRILMGRRRIESNDNGIRDHQKAWYWSVSL